eukprot:9476022-Pyramimonas_sp.AAC.4
MLHGPCSMARPLQGHRSSPQAGAANKAGGRARGGGRQVAEEIKCFKCPSHERRNAAGEPDTSSNQSDLSPGAASLRRFLMRPIEAGPHAKAENAFPASLVVVPWSGKMASLPPICGGALMNERS